VLAGVAPSVALVTLSASMLDLPKADVIDALDSDRYRIQWIMGSFLVGSAAGMTWTGLSASLFGMRRAFLGGLLLFSVMNALCGFVSEVIWMTPLRLLEGIGSGLVLSVGMVLVWRAYPEGRDRAMVVYAFGIYLASIAGLFLGGLLVSSLSWRWIFWVKLPAGALLAWLAWRLLPADVPSDQPVHFDLIGFGSFITWVIALNVALDMGQYWGWLTSPYFVPWLAVCLVAFAVFVAWGLLHDRPLISLRPLARRNFALGLFLKALLTIDVTVLMGLLSGYMIGLRGYQWWQGSLIVLPGLLAFTLVAAATWPWIHPGNRRLRIACGLALMAAATWQMGSVDLYTDKWWLAALFGMWGTGVGLAVGPLLAVIFDGLTPAETVQGAGLFNIGRALPAFAVAACLVTLLTRDTDSHFDRLRLQITRNRPEVQRTEARAAQHFTDRGSGAPADAWQAHAFLGRWVHVNARAYAFQHVLHVLALLTAGAVLLVPGLTPAHRAD
jgi:EmrB/QacA subfamily drug resistance transporter